MTSETARSAETPMLRFDHHGHRSHRTRIAILVVACAAAVPAGGEVLAETKDQSAERLYHEGRQLMAALHTKEACPKFAESYRLDPATGTLLNLAVCNEQLGKLATALAQFRAGQTAATRDGRTDRMKLAREHITRLEPLVSYLQVLVPRATQDQPGLRIQLDDLLIDEATWNAPIAIDAGVHRIEASATAVPPKVWMVTVPAATARVSVTVEMPRAEAATTSLDPIASVAGTPPALPAPGANLRTAGYVTASVAVAALLLTLSYGLIAFDHWHARELACPDNICSTPDGLQAQREAERAAALANVFGGATLAAAGISAYLFYRASAREREKEGDESRTSRLRLVPALSANGVGMSVTGGWP